MMRFLRNKLLLLLFSFEDHMTTPTVTSDNKFNEPLLTACKHLQPREGDNKYEFLFDTERLRLGTKQADKG